MEEENDNVQENISANDLQKIIDKHYRQKATNILNSLAWVILIGGILGAIIIWYTIGTIENPNFNANSFPQRESLTILNASGIITGFAVLFSSIVTSSILFVICDIADNLFAIRKNTEI